MSTDSRANYSDELAVAVLGLLISAGLLKANELFDFFDKTDIFSVAGSALVVRGPEFLAVVGFAGVYVVFLGTTAFAISAVSRRRRVPRHSPLAIVSSVLGTLVLVQFMSLAASYSHAMHRYNDAISEATVVEWRLGTK